MTASWSYSSFSSALTCLRKYKYVYVDKLPEPGLPSIDLAFGSAIHSGLNACLDTGDGQEVFELYWTTYQNTVFEKARFGWEDLARMGAKFIKNFEARYKPQIKPIMMEKRLYAERNGLKLEGTMDCLAEYDGKITLFDWKTSGYNYAPEKALTALQLHLYAFLAVANGLPMPEQLAYLPFIKGTGSIQKPVIIKFDLDANSLMLDEMQEYIVKLSSNDSFPRNPNACIMGSRVCPFLTQCYPKGEDTNASE